MDTNKKLNVICIVGKTSSGKDTIAKHINNKFNIPMVVSCTTRPKREYETNGKEHWFITPEEMSRIVESGDILAYTKFPQTGYEYCAAMKYLPDTENIIYIINPDGINWLIRHCPENTKLTILYVDLDEETIRDRALNRGDNADDIAKRLSSEREEMDKFKSGELYDYMISAKQELKLMLKQVDDIMSDILVA